MITENTTPVKSSGKNRYASKKAYFARNVNGAISKRHKANRAASAAKRKAYWASEVGQARKAAKMNTPEKQAKKAASLKARDARRRERKLAEQKVDKEPAAKAQGFYANP
jgi:hypothetical protein